MSVNRLEEFNQPVFIVVTESGNFREWKQPGEPVVGERMTVGRSSERVEVVCPGQWDSVEHFWDWFVDIGQRARTLVAAEQKHQAPVVATPSRRSTRALRHSLTTRGGVLVHAR